MNAIERRLAGADGCNRVHFSDAQLAHLCQAFGVSVARYAPPAPPTLDQYPAPVTTRSTTKGEFVFRASTAAVDRMGDTIAVQGWQLGNFHRTGAPILWAHDSGSLPVGRGRAWKTGDALMVGVTFADTRMGQTVRGLVSQGFLRSVSVGFAPQRFELSRSRPGSIDFFEQELLEVSIVPVPANADATLVQMPEKSAAAKRRERELELVRLRQC
jgi:HK97 family phage prohead protease